MKALTYFEKTLFIVAQIFFLVFFVRAFMFDVGRINGRSMFPTFTDSEVFIINRLAHLMKPPERYEIIQAIQPGKHEALVIKRVIAMPGETVEFKEGDVLITDLDGNTRAVHEEYLHDDKRTFVNYGRDHIIQVPENAYFVMGDNRRGSTDSRDYGPVGRELIIGSVIQL